MIKEIYVIRETDLEMAIVNSKSRVYPMHVFLNSSRQFLWSFRLPGEAQKIDRMMEAFAKRFCDQNPGVFTSSGW